MAAHLRVVIAPFPDRPGLAAVERQVVLALDPPLNLAIVSPSPARRRLAALRKALGQRSEEGSGSQVRVDRPTGPRRAPQARRFTASAPSPPVTDTFARIQRAVSPGDVIHTLGRPSPNRIHGIGVDGVHMSTPRSDRKGRGPQLVPMWMIDEAWRYLVRHGRIDQPTMLDDLRIMRSAFVIALLARFDDVHVSSTRPPTVEYTPRASVTTDP
jgi:hypothetical protein